MVLRDDKNKIITTFDTVQQGELKKVKENLKDNIIRYIKEKDWQQLEHKVVRVCAISSEPNNFFLLLLLLLVPALL